MCMHIFFCQEAQVFAQLNKHFVPESLMPALFLRHQMGPGFLMVKLKGFLKGESLCPLEQFLLIIREEALSSFLPLQLRECQTASTEHFSGSCMPFLEGISPESWQILHCLSLNKATRNYRG